jgi:hypothetical protein
MLLPHSLEVLPSYFTFEAKVNVCFIGTYNCIGKGMALMSVRTTAALIATQFDVRLGPGEDGSDLLERTEDIFTLSMGKLELVFEKKSLG